MADQDMATGLFGWVNRGHHPPVVIRNDRRDVRSALTGEPQE